MSWSGTHARLLIETLVLSRPVPEPCANEWLVVTDRAIDRKSVV